MEAEALILFIQDKYPPDMRVLGVRIDDNHITVYVEPKYTKMRKRRTDHWVKEGGWVKLNTPKR